MYIYIYICIYIFQYILIHIYTYIHMHIIDPRPLHTTNHCSNWDKRTRPQPLSSCSAVARSLPPLPRHAHNAHKFLDSPT